MPTSDQENKYIVSEWLRRINPGVVVDVGVGKGTYSDLAREIPQQWIGIEVFYPYVEQFDLQSKYDRIVISDIRYTSLRSVYPKPDAVIIGDVLEHMTKEEAQQVIKKLLVWAKHVIISVPLMHRDQGAVQGNPFETHVDHWTHAEMIEFIGKRLLQQKKGRILGYYLCKGI